MPRMRVLSGGDTVNIFKKFGFTIITQQGSHIKLRRVHNNHKQTLTIPLHDELDRGTLMAIFRQASKYIPEERLRPYFYTGR
jgi:predicted RNA binding protein YcfA (HicA-like mRNA interferase family)